MAETKYDNYFVRGPKPGETMEFYKRCTAILDDDVIKVSGRGAFETFKYEAGVHRVQRIPATEKRGRVHTSTATVSVLPELEDIDLHINPEDIEFHADQDLLLMADNAVGVKTLTPAFDLDVNGDIGVNGFIYPEVAQATSLGIQLNASDAEWTTTGYMSQPVVSMTLGTAISATVGRIYNLKGASGWVVADAAGASDSTSLLGLSPKTVSTNTFISEGFMQIPSTDFAGTYADGAPLYLDPSNPGQMTFTAPTTGSGVVVRIVGHAVDSVSANRSTFYIIYFRPSSDWIEL